MIDRKRVEKLFPIATGLVDGLRVGHATPNTDSIRASMNAFTVLRSTRSVPMSLFHASPEELFYSRYDFDRVEELVARIVDSHRIDPLIVVVDVDSRPYVLEGAHRLGALYLLKRKRFPAMVVIDES